MRFDRLGFVNFVAGKTSPKAAPKPGSWVFAEDFVGESEQAAQARERAAQLGVAPIGRGSASALTLLANVVQARAVVEVGTGSGVSGLALFAGMQPDGVLTSVDIEPEHQQAAREAFLAVGIPTQRFRLIAGPALSVLPRLSDGGYDMVFIDADKAEYTEYVEEGLRLLRHGGVLALDNALWHDRTADESYIDAETEAIRKALDAVKDNEDLVSSLLPVGDGLLVAARR
jgi:predicted O-methyltransferase YrrM